MKILIFDFVGGFAVLLANWRFFQKSGGLFSELTVFLESGGFVMSVAEFFFEILEHTFYNSPAFRGSAFATLALRANCLSQPLQSGLGFSYEKRQLFACGWHADLQNSCLSLNFLLNRFRTKFGMTILSLNRFRTKFGMTILSLNRFRTKFRKIKF